MLRLAHLGCDVACHMAGDPQHAETPQGTSRRKGPSNCQVQGSISCQGRCHQSSQAQKSYEPVLSFISMISISSHFQILVLVN